jgi:hypothetical protein
MDEIILDGRLIKTYRNLNLYQFSLHIKAPLHKAIFSALRNSVSINVSTYKKTSLTLFMSHMLSQLIKYIFNAQQDLNIAF